MTYSPMAYAESLHIGTVHFASPDEIKVLLDIEAPNTMAMNTGTVRPFPRINGYILIPADNGYLVAQVEWITIEHSQYPKRKGMQDFGLIDLPYPLRKMSLNPLGCLSYESNRSDKEVYVFKRGVEVFPTVGDPVLLPTQDQLKAIVESGKNRHVKIGTSPLAANAEVKIDPDRLFGRHLAVLGNTGSGKSCSVAGLIRWSLEAAKAEAKKDPNARFIILDPNGEYTNTFNDMSKVKVFAVEPSENMEQLQVPLWFWNSAEWGAFTQASAKTQRPLLRRALKEIKYGQVESSTSEEKKLVLRRYLSSKLTTIRSNIETDVIKNESTKFGIYLKAVMDDIRTKEPLHTEYKDELISIIEKIDTALKSTFKSFDKNNETIEYYIAFTENSVTKICQAINILLDLLGGILYQESSNEDAPLPFDGGSFVDHVSQLAMDGNVSQYIDFLVTRIRMLLSDERMKPIISSKKDITLDQWLNDYIGDNQASNGSITIIDLSLVPAEVVHLITAVIARMTLEALQRYRKLNQGQILPTVLVMEEAHTFIKRYKEDAENQNTSAVCCQVFEKIAREGRKFGLGLLLSSQRPSELSPTVLSQCNSYLLHRISNDKDQELVRKLVPDNLRGLLRDLPSLPARHAVLLGWASELPVLVQMNHLPDNQRPKSEDPDFWNVWTGNEDRKVNWKEIADDWQQINKNPPENESEKS